MVAGFWDARGNKRKMGKLSLFSFFFLRRTFLLLVWGTHIHSGFGGVCEVSGGVSTAIQLSRNKMGEGGEGFLSKCYVPDSDWEFYYFDPYCFKLFMTLVSRWAAEIRASAYP